MHPVLENLCGPGKPLKAEAPDANEFAGLLRTGIARLRDAQNTTMALESRFDLAYNAAHALCLAALRRMGYRSSNRYSLNNFFALDAPLVNEWTLFDNSSQAQARPVENRIGGQFTLMDSDKWQNLQKHNPAA